MTGFSAYFDSSARRVLVLGINVYQRQISPRKGFRCASRALHGGNSCSQEIKRLLLERPFREALKGARQQFALCHDASRILRAARMKKSSVHRFDNDPPPDEESKEPSWRKNRNRRGWFNRQPDCCEFGDCACHGAELGECLMPHGAHCGEGLPLLHALDCSALNCAVLDCGAIDCSCLECAACWPF